MSSTPVAIRIECAKGQIMNVMQKIQDKYALPPCIIDGIISSILEGVRAESKLELLNDANAMLEETNAELERAREEAKKVIRAEPE